MSFVSNGSLNEKTTPYIGNLSSGGFVARVERAGGFERVGQLAEKFADRRRTGRKRPKRRMTVKLALAGDRTLAADVQRRERVELAGIGLADDHAVFAA